MPAKGSGEFSTETGRRMLLLWERISYGKWELDGREDEAGVMSCTSFLWSTVVDCSYIYYDRMRLRRYKIINEIVCVL